MPEGSLTEECVTFPLEVYIFPPLRPHRSLIYFLLVSKRVAITPRYLKPLSTIFTASPYPPSITHTHTR